MRRIATFAAALLPIAAAAGPQPYPHKAGVAPDASAQEEGDCFTAARAAMHAPPGTPNPYTPPQATLAGAAAVGAAAGFARGLEQGRIFKLTLLNCMTSKGYTYRAMPRDEWRALKKLPAAERQAKIDALVGAPVALHPEMPRDEMD